MNKVLSVFSAALLCGAAFAFTPAQALEAEQGAPAESAVPAPDANLQADEQMGVDPNAPADRDILGEGPEVLTPEGDATPKGKTADSDPSD